jgi:transposase
MEQVDGKRTERRARVYRTIEEKRRIVELTLEPGASVARVAQAEGVNSHQVFDWRRAYLKGKLAAREHKPSALLPVILSPAETSDVAVDTVLGENSSIKPGAATPGGGAIHIELPGRAKIRVEGGVDGTLLRTVLESLRP